MDHIVSRFESIAADRIEQERRSREYRRELEVAQQKAARRLVRQRERAKQPTMLRELADDWREAARMQLFLGALEDHLQDRLHSEAMAQWLAWARGHVAALDPLYNDRLAELEALAQLVAPCAEDADAPDPDEEERYSTGALDEYL